jgi:hypothetical protein
MNNLMADEQIEKLGLPFYSTKETGVMFRFNGNPSDKPKGTVFQICSPFIKKKTND